jgi:hypothetical protein
MVRRLCPSRPAAGAGPILRAGRRYNAGVSSPAFVAPRTVTIRVLPQQESAIEAYFVAGTPAERIAMVWPLTLEVLAFSGAFDAQSRLSRSVVGVRELEG